MRRSKRQFWDSPYSPLRPTPCNTSLSAYPDSSDCDCLVPHSPISVLANAHSYITSHPVMASHGKRVQPDLEAFQSKSRRHTKRRRAARSKTAGLQEAADNTTAQIDVRYMGTQPKIRQPTETLRAKSFPGQISQFINLTLSDEVEEGFPTFSSRSKALQHQAEEQSHSRYALRSKTLGNTRERFLNPPRMASARPLAHTMATLEQEQSEHPKSAGQRFPERTIHQNEGEERWTLPQKPLILTHRFSKRPQKWEQSEQRVWNAEREATREERTTARSANDTWEPSTSTDIMFTIPEAMTALVRSQLADSIAYNLPTGAYISYPVKRSYHLGAMGRYTCRSAY
jgi:hypothetical protein